jgi:Ser/Thr protein kinase RdoA (MazF antagonist)
MPILGVHNFVFARGQACPIDFDEWGYGAYLFDLAAPLRSFLPFPTDSTLRDALLAAYTGILPDARINDDHLAACIAAQCMGYINWLLRFAPAYASKAIPEVMYIKQLCAV